MLVLENDKPFIYLPLFYLKNESFEKSTESSNMHIYMAFEFDDNLVIVT